MAVALTRAKLRGGVPEERFYNWEKGYLRIRVSVNLVKDGCA